MSYIIKVGAKYICTTGLTSSKSGALRYDLEIDAELMGCIQTARGYNNVAERMIEFENAKIEKRFEIEQV